MLNKSALLIYGLALGWSVVGCANSTPTLAETVPTNISVIPNSFSGTVACNEGESRWRSYVVTLTDVTAGNRVVLPSSPPIPCFAPVSFGTVVAGHLYVGDIDGYDQPPCESNGAIAPCIQSTGGFGSGQRAVVDTTGALVTPRWKTLCGDSNKATFSMEPISVDGPTTAADLVSVPLRACVPFAANSTGADRLDP